MTTSATPTTPSASKPPVSEAAQLVASLVGDLPEQTAHDLRRLLARKLTLPSPAEIRHQRLGLLMDLVAGADGVVPTMAVYSRAREERLAKGQDYWASATTLGEAYGSWPRAVRAAMWLHADGSAGKVPRSNAHRTYRKRSYTHAEVAAAVRACAQAIGTPRPTEWEYADYRLLTQELARAAGQPVDEYPTRSVWMKLYGSWLAVLDAAAA